MSAAKKILAIGIPAAAVAVTLTALGLTIYNQKHDIDSLRAQLSEQNNQIPAAAVDDVSEKKYEPVEVDHYYERTGYKIYLKDDQFGQIWLPTLADVPLSTHPEDRMEELKNGRMTYYNKDGTCGALTGIDISTHNRVSDWNAVKANGIDFVMLRVGYRGYGKGTGTLKPDDSFRQYYNDAKAAGLKVGAYFFSQAISEEEAVEEAMLAVEQLDGCDLDFPVVYDWELIFHDSESRTENLAVDILNDCCLAFCQNVEAYGYQPMIYQNKRTTLFKLDLPRLQGIPFWLAEYGDGPTYPYDYDMWQYSCTGHVDGIEGDVDLNLCFYDYSQDGAPAVSFPASEIYTEGEKTEDSKTDDDEDGEEKDDEEDDDSEEEEDSEADNGQTDETN